MVKVKLTEKLNNERLSSLARLMLEILEEEGGSLDRERLFELIDEKMGVMPPEERAKYALERN